jgi:hypothetical protein
MLPMSETVCEAQDSNSNSNQGVISSIAYYPPVHYRAGQVLVFMSFLKFESALSSIRSLGYTSILGAGTLINH